MTNTKPNICPCTDCILIPICRHKVYLSLFEDCSIIDKYVKNGIGYLRQSKCVEEVERVLKPIKWFRSCIHDE